MASSRQSKIGLNTKGVSVEYVMIPESEPKHHIEGLAAR